MADDCAVEAQTDASYRGLGVWFQGPSAAGGWDSTFIQLHIE